MKTQISQGEIKVKFELQRKEMSGEKGKANFYEFVQCMEIEDYRKWS
jgi:hypothetical protein